MTAHPDTVLIIDFGSQVTQLIARRVREAGVYSEIVPFQSAEEGFHRLKPKAVILSGSPASTGDIGAPRAPQAIFEAGIPVLGICYGQMTMCVQLGGKAEPSTHREYGRAFLEIEKNCALFDGIWPEGTRHQVWMSHGDRVIDMPEGFEIFARSPGAPYAVFGDEARRMYGIMFHPEVVHTPDGGKLLSNFVHRVAGLTGDWTMAAFREQAVREIREKVGDGKVICGLSGGVDSSVAAVLIHEAIGDQLTCVFVDHGLLRKNEAAEVVAMFHDHYNLNLKLVDASDRFISALEGEADPEVKRKTIGRLFIDVFEEEAKRLEDMGATADPDAVIIIGAYKPAAEFIRIARSIGIDSLFLTVSFVGSNALASDLGKGGSGVFVSQVVPLYHDTAVPVVASFHNAMAKLSETSGRDLLIDGLGFVSLEGYISGRLVVEVLKELGDDLTRESFIGLFEEFRNYEIDGFTLQYGPGDNQGSNTVFLTVINDDGRFETIKRRARDQ